MTVSGNTQDLSLADLIVAKCSEPGNSRFRLSGPAGDGLIYIEAGLIVHASYGGLPPKDAAYLLATEQNVDFELERVDSAPRHTLQLKPTELLLEAMRRFDEGQLRKPRPSSFDPLEESSSQRRPPRPRRHKGPSPEAEALRRTLGRVLFTADEQPVSSRSSRRDLKIYSIVGAVVGLFAILLLALVSGFFNFRSYRDPVEVTDLRGARDVAPVLLSGNPPETPEPETGLIPTIICRILVDSQGEVFDARVFQSRQGFEAFENAALESVRQYRFTPARRDGLAVPVWVNWPVDFINTSVPVSGYAREPLEASILTGSNDRRPRFSSGEKPSSPVSSGRRPKINCRLLIDANGSVVEAIVIEPSPDLAVFEEAALIAVKNYQFTPAEREGVPVPVWFNWTVEFE